MTIRGKWNKTLSPSSNSQLLWRWSLEIKKLLWRRQPIHFLLKTNTYTLQGMGGTCKCICMLNLSFRCHESCVQLTLQVCNFLKKMKGEMNNNDHEVIGCCDAIEYKRRCIKMFLVWTWTAIQLKTLMLTLLFNSWIYFSGMHAFPLLVLEQACSIAYVEGHKLYGLITW